MTSEPAASGSPVAQIPQAERPGRTANALEEVTRVLRECLELGATVEIDGVGVFRRDSKGNIGFVSQKRKPRIFLAYVVEDAPAVERLFDELAWRGFDPWMDRRKLLPGQNWPRAIEQAISLADFFVACFSNRATLKRGRFQAELRYALDCASEIPLDRVYFIPVRLEECAVPGSIARTYQWVDLFPDWNEGISRLVASIERREPATECRG